MTTEQILAERIKRLHPTCLIRDIRTEYHDGMNFTYSYIAVRKDDTWMRCRLTVEANEGV